MRVPIINSHPSHVKIRKSIYTVEDKISTNQSSTLNAIAYADPHLFFYDDSSYVCLLCVDQEGDNFGTNTKGDLCTDITARHGPLPAIIEDN